MSESKKVTYPDQLLKEMNIERTIFPANASEVGVATLSQEVGSAHILRVYQLLLNREKNSYEIVQELAAFDFVGRKELLEFLDELPHLNGLEMLMLLNPLTNNDLLLN